MRILFDKNVPYPLRPHIVGHDIRTVAEQGWNRLENGSLFSIAEASGFELMVTADPNIQYQQNLKGRRLALVVLSSNHIDMLESQVDKLVTAIGRATTGSYEFVRYSLPPKRQPPLCGSPLTPSEVSPEPTSRR